MLPLVLLVATATAAPPVAVDDSATTAEDTSIDILVLDNDSDPDGDTLSVESATDPPFGSVVNNGISVTYVPDPNFNGTDSFDYTASDGNGGTDTATVSVTVTPVNDAPQAADDIAVTDEDTAVTVDVLSNDVDLDGNTLSVLSAVDPPKGSVAINPDNTLTYTPDPDFNGTDSLLYQASDSHGATDTAVLYITVNPVNDPPVANDDAASANGSAPLTIDVVANDTDIDGDTLSVASVTDPPNGTAVNNGDGTVTYTADAAFLGTDTFTYTASDGNGGTDTATVTVTVAILNNPPVAHDDSATTNEDTAVTIDVIANDSDPDSDPISVSSVTDAADGSVLDNGDGTITYTPDPNFNGSDAFTYTLSDGNGGTDTANVSVQVTPINDQPLAVNDTAVTDEDAPITINVLTNDSDPDGDSLSITSVSTPAKGSAVDNGNGTVTYTPDPDANGIDSFTYTISDGHGGADTATVTVTINPLNDPPVATDDATDTEEDVAVTINVVANDTDIDGDTLGVASVTDPANGSVVNNGDGTVTYTPDPSFSGTDTFEYTVDDGNGGSDTATVTVSVAPAALPPTNLSCSVTGRDVTLTWTNGGSYDSIIVRRNGNDVATLVPSATSYLDAGVDPGSYDYDVVGVVGTKESAPAHCSAGVAVPSVTELSCTAGYLSVDLSWSNPYSDYTSIDIFRDGSTTPLVTLGGQDTSYQDSAAAPGSHSYTVVANYNALSSTSASCSNITVDVPPPRNLTCTPAPQRQDAILTWSNDVAYGSITILRNSTPIVSLAGSATGYTDTVPALGTYTYDVIGSLGSDDSPPASCTVEISYVPPVMLTRCEIDGSRTANLTWTLGALTYDAIEILINGAPAPGSPLSGTTTSYQSAPLDPGTYTFDVVPMVAAYAATPATCSDTAPLLPVTNLVCTPAAETWDVQLSWSNGWTYDTVTIQRNGSTIATLPGAPTAHTDLAPAQGSYTYEVFGSSGGLDSAPVSCAVDVTIIPSVTISQCEFDESRRANLAWTNGSGAYEGIELLIDGAPAPESPLPGSATSYISARFSPGDHSFTLTPYVGTERAASRTCVPGAPLPAPTNLLCTSVPSTWDVTLTWSNGWLYDSVTILRNGTEVVTLPGSPTSHTDTVPGIGSYTYDVYGTLGNQDSDPVSCPLDVTTVPPVTALACSFGPDRVAQLSWANGADSYDAIELLIDGSPAPESPLPGTATSYTSTALNPGSHSFSLRPAITTYQADPQVCSAVSPLPPPTLSCAPAPDTWNVELTWTNAWTYDSVTVVRNGAALTALAGSSTAYTDAAPAAASYSYELIATLAGQDAAPATCVVVVDYVAPVTITQCEVDATRVMHLVWTNGATPYEGIDILINGGPAPESPLPGDATSYDSAQLDPGTHTITVRPFIGTAQADLRDCTQAIVLPPPENLACTIIADTWDVELTWSNAWVYDSVTVLRNSAAIATLPGSDTGYTDTVSGLGSVTYQVYGTLGTADSPQTACGADVTVVPPAALTHAKSQPTASRTSRGQTVRIPPMVSRSS